jgi:hypothetical protein
MLQNWRKTFPEKDADPDKILDEIDSLLPRPDKKSLDILQQEYANGAAMHVMIKKHDLLKFFTG